MERFSVFQLPLHFTENTLISGALMPPEIVDLNDFEPESWPTTPEGEERQAQEWKEMLSYLFASRSVAAVTGWDFADGAWLGAPSGLIRKDNSKKPAYQALESLIRGEWSTKVTVKSDDNGLAHFEGYRGRYRASLSGKDAYFTLSQESGRAELCFS